MTKHKGSLLRQLTISLGLAIVFLSLASFYYQYQTEKRILMKSIRGDLMRQANLLRAWLREARNDATRRRVAAQYVETLGHLNESKQELIVVDRDRKVIAASSGQEPGKVFGSEVLRQAMAPGAPPEGTCSEVGDEYVIALPCYTDAGRAEVSGGILLKRPLTAVDNLADSIMLATFLLLAATLVILVVVVHVVLRIKVHKPIQAIWMQEYRIREGDLARIEAEDPQNEFSDLYAMYNEMVMRIAGQKRAIMEQKDHVALAHLVRQAISRLTDPLDEILTDSRTLLERQSSLSDADRATLKKIIGSITQIARELKSMVVEGDKSATWLKQQAAKIREYDRRSDGQGEQQQGK